ncbi:MAG: exodeoxyribonuclease V subunit gamma [Cyanobacteria bacterium]|nr:exodeoxyribonuclease V subunit gamma [Cyanobacteriota bacterium]
MLTVFRSNRAEILAQILAAQLRLNPPDPLETVQVVVNTWPTSRWLGEQLAWHLGGVAANLRYPFPGARLRELVELVLEPGAPAQDRNVVRGAAAATQAGPSSQPRSTEPWRSPDPWRANVLVWPLLEQLPALAAGPSGAPLRPWLERFSGQERLERDAWHLGRAIADAFDDYGLYRPAMLQAWARGQDLDDDGLPLPPSQQWQAALYRALNKRLACDPFGVRVEAAIERLRRRPPLPHLAGQRMRLFGLSSMAPVQVRLLQALSGAMPVEIFLLTPCTDLWQRCADRRRQLSDSLALAEPFGLDWVLQAPGLEARFGRLGGEFQQLLEGTGEAQLGRWEQGDLFQVPPSLSSESTGDGAQPDEPSPAEPEPAAAAAESDSNGEYLSITAAAAPPAPLLHQLQAQLIEPALVPTLRRAPGDSSLEFHPCPGPLRQVQIVRDRLLQLLAADPSLQPRDILVMTPQVDRFAPLVASVFGDTGATGVELPWRLTDRSQQSSAGIGQALLQLLRLAGGRLSASELDDLLSCRPLQQHFELSTGEIVHLTLTLQHCGFRWGLDGRDRGGDPTHSLRWSLDRLLLGLVLEATPGLAPGQSAPLDAGASLDLTGRWLRLLDRLQHWLTVLRQGALAAPWAELLVELLADLFGDGGEAAWELPPLLAAIDGWQQAAAGCALILDAQVVADGLDEGLSVDSGRFGHRSGALTISALEPMRAIPHRVIVLMGLDAGPFPRQSTRSGFHLMESRRRLGDPDPADQDRYALMEALLSARDHLLISWSCRDDRSGDPLEPASPVRQWMQWLDGELEQGSAVPLARHAPSPLERSNFLPSPERPAPSCDRRLLAARQLLESGPPSPPDALLQGPMPEQLEREAPASPLDDLAAWLKAPQKHWLRSLGLRPGEWQERIEDLDPLALEERQRAALLRDLLAEFEADPELDDAAGPAQSADWLERYRGQGRLPALAGGELEAEGLQQRWASLHSSLEALGPHHREPLAWQSWQGAPRWQGDSLVLVQTARIKPAQRLELWLQLLLAVAAAPSSGRLPRQGVVIARDEKLKNRFSPQLTLSPPPLEQARAELERLAALQQHWRCSCWPVPPLSGWAWVQAEAKRPAAGFEAAQRAWEGGPSQWAERQQEEMVVCFGAGLEAGDLIDAAFGDRAQELWGRLLEAQR